MINKMEHQYSAAGFTGGAITGFAAGIKFFFLQSQLPTGSEVVLKLLTTILLAAVGGIVGMLAKDIYTYWMKPAVKKLLSKKKSKDFITYKNKKS